MKFVFIAKGRLGNAVFRYMGCATFCIKYNGEYTTKLNTINGTINDRLFSEIINNNIPLQDGNYLLSDYYQHDAIYKKYKAEIISSIPQGEKISLYAGFNEVEEAQYIANKAKELISSGISSGSI